MYHNEDTVLDVRLNYLDKFIDNFVIVESTFTHKGDKRNLNFKIENFPEYKNKIIYLVYNEQPNKVSILAYDALGLVYYCWSNNNFKFEKNQLHNKNGFRGLHGKFIIENNSSKQNLKIYKVSKKSFVKVY